jgi:hypothetical protein
VTRYLYYAFSLGLVAVAMPLHAASRPHAETDSQNTMVWTNDDVEKLHSIGLISIVGRIDEERPTLAPAPGPHARCKQRGCAMNLNADKLSSVNTGRRSTMCEVCGRRRAA